MNSELRNMPSNPLERDRYVPDSFKVIGKRGFRRIDGNKKASGKAVYTRDIRLPGMLTAKFLTSPYANARIRKMDTGGAESLPGVRMVLRYDDSEVEGRRIVSTYGGEEEILSSCAYFQGQPLGAVVAADTEQIADDALRLIDIEWEERPFMLNAREALDPEASPSRPEWMGPTNLVPSLFGGPVFRFGDVAKGFSEAEKVVTFNARRSYHGCPDAELLGGVARWEDGCVELWVHHQHPYEHKWTVHKWFDVPMSRVKVNTPYNGGMFGGFNWIEYSQIPTCVSVIIARRTGRPVKWMFGRKEDFTFGSLDAMEAAFEVGMKRDGTITAVKVKTFYENMGYETVNHLLENTRIPHLESETLIAQVNKGPCHALRCEQLPACFGLTHVFNHVAAELGMDPTEVALRNDGVEGENASHLDEFKRTHGFPVRNSLRECIDRGKAAIRWDEKWHLPGTRRLPNGRMHGLGFAWTHEWDDSRGAAAAGLMVQVDGSVNIVGMRADIGVNAETTYCQIVAEELGVRPEDVFFRHQDDVYLPLMTPDGSCNLVTNGYLMQKLARLAKQKLLDLATTTTHLIEYDIPPAFPGANPEDLDITDSVVYVKADPKNERTVAEIVKDLGGSITGKREYAGIQNTTHPPVFVSAWHRQGRFGLEEGRYRLCRQAHFCEVEVDTETGEVDVRLVVNVNDVGKAFSPEAVEGQQYGGTYMGIGRNAREEYIWDQKTGVILNANLLDYKISTMNDIGAIETYFVETEMGLGPYGSVGVGEDVATVTTYLLSGAIHNAVGKWVDDHPITPDKVLRALNKV